FRRLAYFILVEPCERLEDLLQEAALDAASLHAQVAHGFEEGILFGIAGGAVGDFEQGIVGVVEQNLQCLAQLLGGLVAHADECDRQPTSRRSRLLRNGLQVHHFRIGSHRDSLPAVSCCRQSTTPSMPLMADRGNGKESVGAGGPLAIQCIASRSDNDRSKILKFENSPFRWRQFLTAL